MMCINYYQMSSALIHCSKSAQVTVNIYFMWKITHQATAVTTSVRKNRSPLVLFGFPCLCITKNIVEQGCGGDERGYWN